MRKIISLVLISLSLPLFISAQALDQTIATVNYVTASYKKNQAVQLSQVKSELKSIETRLKRATTIEERKQFVDQKVLEILFYQLCEAEKIEATEQEISQYILMNTGGKMTEAEVYANFAKEGITQAEVRKTFKTQLLQLKMVQAKYGAQIQAIKTPSDAEIQKIFDANKSSYVRPDLVVASALVVPFGKNADEKKKAFDLAKSLAAQTKTNSSKFYELMFKSKDPNAGYQVAQDMYIGKKPESEQSLGKALYDAVFALKVNQTSDVVEANGQIPGYVVVMVTKVEPQTFLSLKDEVLPGKGTTVSQAISSQLMQQKQQEIAVGSFNKLMEEAKTKSVTYKLTGDKLVSALNF